MNVCVCACAFHRMSVCMRVSLCECTVCKCAVCRFIAAVVA